MTLDERLKEETLTLHAHQSYRRPESTLSKHASQPKREATNARTFQRSTSDPRERFAVEAGNLTEPRTRTCVLDFNDCLPLFWRGRRHRSLRGSRRSLIAPDITNLLARTVELRTAASRGLGSVRALPVRTTRLACLLLAPCIRGCSVGR